MAFEYAEASKQIGAELDILAETLLTDPVSDRNIKSEGDTVGQWLPASEVQYRALFRHAADAIYLFDPSTKRVLDANQAFLSLTGYTAADVQHLRIYEFITQDRDKTAAQVWHIVMSGAAARGEQVWRRKDGALITVQNAVSIFNQAGGRAVGFVIARDVTERTRADEARDGLLKELEAKNREMEHFTYTVAHDLKSPLVTLQGFVTMLRADSEQNDREKAENDLQHIEHAVTTMGKLLNDTLQLARSGRITSQPENLPFGALVQNALEQTAELVKSSGVDVSVADTFPGVHADRMRIAEVLVNLIENSIQYRGDAPRPTIEIGYRQEEEGGEAVFFVRDNGIGIDKAEHEKVFELFYRVDYGKGKGTGAGLAIVRRIIKVHGGRVWVESEKGNGCTVCFTLPGASLGGSGSAIGE